MWKTKALFVLALLVVATAVSYEEEGEEEEWEEGGGSEGGSGRREGEDWFVLQDSKQVVKTDAGAMKVVRGFGGRFLSSPMHVGFITMEPRSLFIPQYLDSSLILFIRRGEARVGNIYKDELVERSLKMGDIYRIGSGSAFYLINTGEGQRLHVVCSIDTSDSLGWHAFQSFYVAGGTYPRSVLSGFDPLTLSTAFNVSEGELSELLRGQNQGPIVYLSEPHSEPHSRPSVWSKFLDMERDEKLAHMKRIVSVRGGDFEQEEEAAATPTWSFRKLLMSMFGKSGKRGDKSGRVGKGPDSYNIYDRKPDFKNDYGWSIALDESDYSPLKHDDFGVYLVNLTAGSMMAPHVNPRATEYGIVLSGVGTIQIVYPNGTLAMNAKVTEGDVFWIPRYFPFCQIASRTGPFEFFGFTTSARDNRPQFLAGANSLLNTMRGPEFAAAFGLSEDRLKEILESQRESVILPSAAVAPPGEKSAPKLMEKIIDRYGSEMVMGF
ncbi:vicilin-like seed storage protein At2g28490 [Henckelia pumila]|uniref:vicilin-like seed storage protein At2g28490 n=1 Tax=Henckelia pumila TaxID=405737 RepID=UPI003C6E617A